MTTIVYRLRMTRSLIGVGALVAALSLSPAGAQDSPPDAPGKQTVARVCGACHDLDTATGMRHTRAEWRAVVDAMVDRGARATDDELAVITEYLVTYVGLVNVNKATAAEIEAVVAIPAKHAEAIVAYRGEHGVFKDLDALKSVPGVDAMLLEERKDRIAFQ